MCSRLQCRRGSACTGGQTLPVGELLERRQRTNSAPRPQDEERYFVVSLYCRALALGGR